MGLTGKGKIESQNLSLNFPTTAFSQVYLRADVVQSQIFEAEFRNLKRSKIITHAFIVRSRIK